MSRTKKTAKKYYDNKKQNGRRGESSREEAFEERGGATESKTNDPFWYSSDPVLLRDSASIPWNAAAGTKQSLASAVLPDKEEVIGGINVHFVSRLNQGGVQIIKLAPTIGLSDVKSSPINIAMNSLYTKVRFQNSGHANYDAPDLMIYTLAMSEIYAMLQWLMRIYGICSLFTQRNRFVPEQLLKAEGVNYESIKHNLSNFRYGINLLISKAASLCVPGNFTLFLRRAFVYSGIYTEGTSIKDQMYMYSPDGIYRYATNSDGSGMLKYDTMFGRLAEEQDWTYDELLDLVDDMLQRVIESEDCQIMSGDILKAFGENVLKLGTLSPDYTIIPTLDVPVLEQMKNATVYPGYVNGNDIVQDASHAYLMCDPCIAVHGASEGERFNYFGMQSVITTTTGDPSPEVTMENTRLVCPVREISDPTKVGDDWWTELHLYTGTEFPTDLIIVAWTFMEDEIRAHYPARTFSRWVDASMSTPGSRPGDDDYTVSVAALNSFKFTPGYWMNWCYDEDGDRYYTYTYSIDVDNFTVQPTDVIRNIHETAIMSEVNVPAINRLS